MGVHRWNLHSQSGFRLSNHLLTLLLAFSFWFSNDCFGWHINTHSEITRDAISLMPEELKSIFSKNEKIVESAILDPDTLIKDWVNHYYIPANSEGGGVDRIDKLAVTARLKLEKASYADAIRQLCYLAHYIADLWSPESIVKNDSAADNDFFLNHNIVVLYDGYQQPIENIRGHLQQRSVWRWQLENSPQISTLLYSEAVNDIANVWITLWQQTGKSVGVLPAAMLEHKREALNVRSSSSRYSSRFSQSWTSRMSSSEARRLYAQVAVREEQARLSRISPKTPFEFVESSLKQAGSGSFFVARIRNNSQKVIPSIAFLYPGVKGAAATVSYLEPGQVAKVEAQLPANANKDEIEIVFASVE